MEELDTISKSPLRTMLCLIAKDLGISGADLAANPVGLTRDIRQKIAALKQSKAESQEVA